MRLRLACAFALALLFPLPAATIAMAEEAGEVNVYSYRQPYLINPLFKAFTEQTGIRVNVIFAEKGLIERIQAEGRNSPADVLLTVDVGNLTQATDAGISQPIQSPALEAAIPPAYRAADNQWFGLTRPVNFMYGVHGVLLVETAQDLLQAKIGAYGALEAHTTRGQICEVRRCVARVSIQGKISRPHSVKRNQKDIGRLANRYSASCPAIGERLPGVGAQSQAGDHSPGPQKELATAKR